MMMQNVVETRIERLQEGELFGQHKTPLMVIEKCKIVENIKEYQRLFPQIKAYYAVKANPFPEIVKTLIDMGTGFDCASFEEINQVLRLGARAEDIVFANPIKTEYDLRMAKEAGVNLYFFDNEYELDKIARVVGSCKVVLRINVPNTDSVVKLSQKFGANPSLAIDLLVRAVKLNLQPVGLSFHVGSQCIRIQNFTEALGICRRIFKKAAKIGINLNLVDIGGGFPVQYFDHQRVPTLQEIQKELTYEIKYWETHNVTMISEPGRYVVANSGTLFTRVIGKAKRNEKFYYYLDDGLYQDFSGVVFDHCHYPFETLKKGETFESVLAGPTCDSFDIIDSSIFLPELDIGDVVAVKCMGAYTNASARSDFNGIQPAKMIMI